MSRRATQAIGRSAARTVRPIVKWAGGKSKLLPALRAQLPAQFGRYLEPFCGGAALFFDLAPRRAVVSDINADLIGMYRCVARDVEAVLELVEHHRGAHCAAHYYATRQRWNERRRDDGAPDRAAMLLYLNKTCYNGLWRVNRGGAFNVPMGRYVDPQIADAEVLRAAAGVLARAELRACDYGEAVAAAVAGDVVYFDPPYVPLSRTARFASYSAAGFGMPQHERLAATVRVLVDRGVTVLASNHDTPAVRALYRGFHIVEVVRTQAINSQADRRGAVAEVVVVGRPA